ncbi:flagellar motor protein MotB [Pigmentiphaga soli]|uniref:Flagellar motor protein MotB n=1 Tax=Pigmentiphaga soli TaxID=1007095 RepID=A0ABP8HPV0_9BURK
MALKDGIAPIVVRKTRKHRKSTAHAGMWKIAYADFVTAMMAFFLLMWLLTTSAEADLKGISEYFQTPLKVTLSSGKVSGDPVALLTGGQSLNHRRGETQGGDPAQAQIDERDRQRLEALQAKLRSLVLTQAVLKPFSDQILIDFTDEGLRIQIVDERNRPMFDTGKTELKDYSREILGELARALNGVDNKISIAGHTDSAPYAGGDAGYSNWELSADRANAARRAMLAAGMAPDKALRVIGLADSVPFDHSNPRAPENRRISIVVLNKRSEEFLKKDGIAVDVPAVSGKTDDVGEPWRQSGTRADD